MSDLKLNRVIELFSGLSSAIVLRITGGWPASHWSRLAGIYRNINLCDIH